MEEYDGRGQQKDSLVFTTIMSGSVGIIDKWQRVVDLSQKSFQLSTLNLNFSQFYRYYLKL